MDGKSTEANRIAHEKCSKEITELHLKIARLRCGLREIIEDEQCDPYIVARKALEETK